MATDVGAKPWEQLPGEPDTAYVRFLIYRDLGPSRSIDSAYAAATAGSAPNGTKAHRRANGQWKHDSAEYHWPERARAWDIAVLSELVPETASLIFTTINEAARVTLEKLREGKLKPRTWPQLLESVTILAGFISPEVISATVDHAANDGPVPSQADGDPE